MPIDAVAFRVPCGKVALEKRAGLTVHTLGETPVPHLETPTSGYNLQSGSPKLSIPRERAMCATTSVRGAGKSDEIQIPAFMPACTHLALNGIWPLGFDNGQLTTPKN